VSTLNVFKGRSIRKRLLRGTSELQRPNENLRMSKKIKGPSPLFQTKTCSTIPLLGNFLIWYDGPIVDKNNNYLVRYHCDFFPSPLRSTLKILICIFIRINMFGIWIGVDIHIIIKYRIQTVS
jgi:hypothetical protein